MILITITECCVVAEYTLRSEGIYAFIKNAKIVILKMMYGRPGIDYICASLFTRYPTAIGIIPENLKSIGQF